MKLLCIKIVIVVVFVIFACNVSMYPKKPIVTYTHEKFDMSSYNEDCPIEISSTMYENEYHNSIVVTINNKTDAVISAVKFLFTCKNVYGEVVSNKKYKLEISGILTDTGVYGTGSKIVLFETGSVDPC